ncbi:MAG: hypothetical protein CVU00_07520 [Bacteroidetes bacterium HGW-Bacteroidetes-17]|nr:MAG: hypothetical protein CVU00_07520 [Bacteroidetes bacterium HGW-Bacteroidetes-17]
MKSILAIDDKKNNLLIITALINDSIPDCKVLVAMSGKEGIEIAQREQPDTILLDIIMPEMDGFETCKRLKIGELTKHIPVVLITAVRIDTESRIEGLNIGADAFLSKPIDPSEFIAQVNVMLRIKEAEDKLRKENEFLEELVKKRTIEISNKNKRLQNEILERKQTEIEIKKLARRNQLILDTTMDGYILTNPDGSIIDVNPAYCKLIGYSREELLKMNIDDINVGMLEKETEIQAKQLLCHGNIHSEALHKHKNGKLLNLDMSINLMNIDKKNMVFAFIRDITKQKYVEQIQKVLLNISNAAFTSDNLLKLISLIQKELGTIIDTTNFYIALYDSKTGTLSLPFMADEKDRITSIPTGKTLTYYVIKTKKSLLATKERLAKLEELGEVGKFGTDSEIWLGVPLKIKNEVIGVLAVQSYTDEFAYSYSDLEILEFISKQISISINRKNAEQDLKDALKKATESDRLKSAFLATMSHELRTPLNAVIGFSELIRNEKLSIEEIVSYNNTINASGNNLLSIIEDIFEIILIESGEIKIIKEDVALLPLLNDIHETIKNEQFNLGKLSIDLKLIIPPENDSIRIYTDPLKFKQILLNLLKNALKFTHKGYVQYGFILEQDIEIPILKFFVKDTGIGIPKKKQQLIFEIFRQADDTHTRKYGGPGIGLSIAKKLTELLGGKIWLESENNKGSNFYFTMPSLGSETNNYISKLKQDKKG